MAEKGYVLSDCESETIDIYSKALANEKHITPAMYEVAKEFTSLLNHQKGRYLNFKSILRRALRLKTNCTRYMKSSEILIPRRR